MKTSINIILLFLFISFCNSFSQLPIDYRVKGGYKQCEHFECGYKNGILDTSIQYNIITSSFDSIGNINEYDLKYDRSKIERIISYQNDLKGHCIKEIICDYNGLIRYETFYLYDSLNQRISNYTILYSGNMVPKEILWQENYIYNNEGKLIEEITDYNKFYILYDSFGNKIEESWFSLSGNFEYKNQYKYDSEGNKIEEITYDIISKTYRTSTNCYDKDNNLIERNNFNENNKFIGSRIFSYDNFGNKVESVWYDRSMIPIEKEIYIYSK